MSKTNAHRPRRRKNEHILPRMRILEVVRKARLFVVYYREGIDAQTDEEREKAAVACELAAEQGSIGADFAGRVEVPGTKIHEALAEVRAAWGNVLKPGNPEDLSGQVKVLEKAGKKLEALVKRKKRFNTHIVMVPGGFVYRNLTTQLSGKPWQVLNAFVKSRTHRKTARELLDEIWEDKLAVEQNVKDGVKTVRTALRQALRKSRVKKAPKDPIPCVDKRPNLSWELKMV